MDEQREWDVSVRLGLLPVEDERRVDVAKALYWSLLEALHAEGVDGLGVSKATAHAAQRAALRASRSATLVAMGFSRTEIAEALDVSAATVKRDVARARAVRESGAFEAFASRRLPPVPVDDRVSMTRFRTPVG